MKKIVLKNLRFFAPSAMCQSQPVKMDDKCLFSVAQASRLRVPAASRRQAGNRAGRPATRRRDAFATALNTCLADGHAGPHLLQNLSTAATQRRPTAIFGENTELDTQLDTEDFNQIKPTLTKSNQIKPKSGGWGAG
jgi:hypothetical protein